MNRKFLVQTLPEPLDPASAHLQIFDNYIEGTRLRLRLIRDPHTKKWTRRLQQCVEAGNGETNVSEIHLNDAEYAKFERFRGLEIRKNRYFHEYGSENWHFDVYLGEARGLCIGTVNFNSRDELSGFEPPPFALIEITGDPFFSGEKLVKKSYAEIREEVARLGKLIPTAAFTAED